MVADSPDPMAPDHSHARVLVRTLIGLRGIRGTGQGMMLTGLALSLKTLGWSGTEIGFLLSLGALGEMGAGLAVGFLSGRQARARRLLLLGELASLSGALAALASSLFSLGTAGFWVATLLGGFGQRSNGSPGPFVPAEQALLSRTLPPEAWSRTGSLLISSGFCGMGIGALLSLIASRWPFEHGGLSSLAVLYGFQAIVSFCSLMLVARLMGIPLPHDPRLTHTASEDQSVRSREHTRIGLLVLINLMGGLAIGLSDLLIPYWFSVRYHATSGMVAPMMAFVFLLTGFAALTGGSLVRSLGELPFFFGTQGASILLLLAFPWVPWIAGDVLLLALRFVLTRSPVGIRQAFVNRLVRTHRVGTVVSFNILSLQAGQLAGPVLAGAMIDRAEGWAPFILAGMLQAAGLGLSWTLFSRPAPTPEPRNDPPRD